MSASVFQSIATQFASRWLHPLQFPDRKRRGQGQPSEQPAAGPGHASDEHFNAVMARSADLLERTKRPHSTTWAQDMGQRLGEKHDRVEDADVARRLSRTDTFLQNVRATAARHDEWAPGPVPAPRPTPSPSRVAQIPIPGMPGPSALRAPQQFGLAATSAPPSRTQQAPAAKRPRVVQPGLFPKPPKK
jgi:hypothetical protein